jgi:hypothetical protein
VTSRGVWRELEQRGERAGGHLGLELVGVTCVVEQVRVDARRCCDLRMPEDPVDLRDVEGEIDDQVARERVAQVVDAQRLPARPSSNAARVAALASATLRVAMSLGACPHATGTPKRDR